MPARNLSHIEREIEQLQAKRAQLLAVKRQDDRKQRTRQAAILGGWLLAHDPATVQQILVALKRPQDRAAFGLDAPPPLVPQQPDDGAAISRPGEG
jgi:hypothetical protein